MPRKHLIASQTNKKQQHQAKIWMKLAREIKAAAKIGGPNLEANPRLKAAIDKALQNNLSRESIEKNIKGSTSKDNVDLISCEYECYGPNGLQIIIQALTDNQNRTVSNLRGYLSKINGSLAKTNSVKMFFEKRGVIIVAKDNQVNLDQILEATLSNQIIDIIELEDCFEIITDPEDFFQTKASLQTANIKIFDAEIKLIAQNQIDNFDSETTKKLDLFLDKCEQDDDIQWVVTNWNH